LGSVFRELGASLSELGSVFRELGSVFRERGGIFRERGGIFSDGRRAARFTAAIEAMASMLMRTRLLMDLLARERVDRPRGSAGTGPGPISAPDTALWW
jgi:hypothetical protein